MTSGNRPQPPIDEQAHRAHTLQAVARFLANQPHPQIPLADLARVLPRGGTGAYRQLVGSDIRAVAQRLHILGFVRVHHGRHPTVAVLHREGLGRLAAGEPLPAVAADVERTRALTIIRTTNGQYAAWYLSVLLLPASAYEGKPDWAAVVAPTADEAVDALRRSVRGALLPEPAAIGQ